MSPESHNVETTWDEATGRWFYVCRDCWVTSWEAAPEVPCRHLTPARYESCVTDAAGLCRRWSHDHEPRIRPGPPP